MTTPPLEETSVLQTTLMRSQRTAIATPLYEQLTIRQENDDASYRSISNEKPHNNDASSPTNEWLLRPRWLTYINANQRLR
jgi:hypothetical protein